MLTHIKMLPALCGAALALVVVTAPYKVTLENHSLEFHTLTAWAKDGGKGGAGGGASNGNGGGNSGNAGGKGGNGENGGGNGGANAGGNSGNSAAGGNNGNNAGRKGGGGNQFTPAESVAINGPAMEVRHWNGMSERIKDGRYVMKDAKGRTIINRTATTTDESRLRSFDR
jgi:hypothetical protein